MPAIVRTTPAQTGTLTLSFSLTEISTEQKRPLPQHRLAVKRCSMWLMAMGLTLGGLGILAFTSRRWLGAREGHLGWMSEQWLAEHRADTT